MTAAAGDGGCVVVVEAVTGGLCGEVQPSLRAEGEAMREAAVASLSRAGRTVVTPVIADQSLVLRSASGDRPIDDWRAVFNVRPAAALLVAPETGGMLAGLIREFQSRGVALSANCRAEDVELLGDKLRTFRRIGGILPIVRTVAAAEVETLRRVRGPFVVKPRDGAGTGFRLSDRPEAGEGEVCQPYVEGTAYSVLGLFADDRSAPIMISRQDIATEDGRGVYRGGVSKAEGCSRLERGLLRTLTFAMPRLRGPVGIDYVRDSAGEVHVVDINPRLTTSFLAYAACGRWPDLFAGPDAAPRELPDGVRWRVGERVTVDRLPPARFRRLVTRVSPPASRGRQ